MNTYIRKGRNGWQAEATIDLENNRVLTLSTKRRYNDQVTTNASVATREGDFLNHVMYKDFNKTIMIHETIKRVTEKSIESAHDAVLTAFLESVIENVNLYYSEQAKN